MKKKTKKEIIYHTISNCLNKSASHKSPIAMGFYVL